MPAPAKAAPLRHDEGRRPLPLPTLFSPAQTAPVKAVPRPPTAPPPETSPEPIRSVAGEDPDRRAAPADPLPPKPQPSPRDRMVTSEIRLPPQRMVREIELTDGEPVHAPSAPQQRIVVRETVRTPVEPPQKPQPPEQKAPRTAAEASVIGPLPRPDLTRARVELWLR